MNIELRQSDKDTIYSFASGQEAHGDRFDTDGYCLYFNQYKLASIDAEDGTIEYWDGGTEREDLFLSDVFLAVLDELEAQGFEFDIDGDSVVDHPDDADYEDLPVVGDVDSMVDRVMAGEEVSTVLSGLLRQITKGENQ